MKTIIVTVLALGLVGSLISCSEKVDGAKGVAGSQELPSYVEIITDEATGCQYLVTGNGGLTPRLDQGGLRAMGCRG